MDWKQLAADFRQKYEGCWCFVTLEGHDIPDIFYLEYVNMQKDGAPFLHLDNDSTGEIILKYDESKSDIEFRMPPIGLYQFDNKVVMLRKQYSRQWKAGLCSSTMEASDIYYRILPHRIVSRESWREDLVRKVFQKRKQLSIKDAVKQLDTKISVALSEEFAIGHSVHNDGNLLVFYYENPIGLLNPTTHQVVLKETAFEQEFQDFTRRIEETENHGYHW